MASPGEFKANFNAGEFGPEMAGRIDVKAYYAGAAAMKNVLPVPQGGFRLAPGSRALGPCRRPVTTLAVTTTATAGPALTGATVIWTGTVNGIVAGVHLLQLSTTGAAVVTVEAQALDDVWRRIGAVFTLPAGATRDLTAVQPPGAGVFAKAVRVTVAPVSGSINATVAFVTPLTEDKTAAAVPPVMIRLRETASDAYMLLVSPRIVDVYRGGVHVGGAFLNTVSAEMLPTLGHYAEAQTVGLFHWDLKPVRIRRFTGHHDWAADDWPFQDIPKVEYDGTYAKVADVWEIFINWATEVSLSVVLLVDGEATPAIRLGYAPTGPWTEKTTSTATETDWTNLALGLQAELRTLPSLGPAVTVTQVEIYGRRRLIITFGGALAGVEYDVSAQIPNTSSASALPTHTQVGETIGEPAISTTRGWPRAATLVQDRMAYAGLKARRAAVMLSAVGEYFDVDIRGQKDSSARLDAIRTQSAEEIRTIVDSKYLIAFTDQSVYFVPNRTLSRNEPLNFVKTSSKGVGIADGTDVIDVEDQLYFVGTGGSIVYTAQYNDVSTSYTAAPISLRSSHLVKDIVRTAQQAPDDASDATRMWMLRGDGRLVVAVIVVAEEMVFGAAEWRAAGDDPIRALKTDAENRLWIAIERGKDLLLETLEEGLLLQAAVTVVVAGEAVITGLDRLEGRDVWALTASGRVEGPMQVRAGKVALAPDYVGETVTLGLWRAPLAETMPMIRMVADNTILRRPGRIHTARVSVLDTTSIAVGANGEEAEDVSLARVGDALDAPTPARTEILDVDGLLGAVEGPTLTITQARPGRLSVRDVTMEAVL